MNPLHNRCLIRVTLTQNARKKQRMRIGELQILWGRHRHSSIWRSIIGFQIDNDFLLDLIDLDIVGQSPAKVTSKKLIDLST